ncbi:MAG: hypothetical protein COS99_05725 [Candidatus Omnitrophica bacterium CG07_land_8_20_14_0_80_42_15]|uniref:Polyprenyl synthetase family protein n=1 Tax=Candidatus Aquitaenariimonas noxiae TaxID=1974741 RepID=A0A2J0KU99_9BACT|nr:MAG: hypothetical protein COS99_05725 [Candidatus Omnitrophica bacterium CG07_land_8_20_14_0_80_42_15]
MLNEIKNRIFSEIRKYTRDLRNIYSSSKLSPALFKHIEEFLLRDSKKIRPVLFAIGYLGFTGKPASGLYRSALSVEILHDFMLVHDDIIDKSDVRRGRPSMHSMLDKYVAKYKNIKFNGADLAIITGDVIYAMGIGAFLSIKENPERKEAALKQLINTAIYTGTGEFLELLSETKELNRVTKDNIYKIYDLKTANYSFACPLALGAILAGAKKRDVNKLIKYGIFLGRAFQIKDDLLDMVPEERRLGKSAFSDLRSSKRTILIWHAYNNSDKKDKLKIKSILEKDHINRLDLSAIQKIIDKTGTINYAKREIDELLKKAGSIRKRLKINETYKNILISHSEEIFDL